MSRMSIYSILAVVFTAAGMAAPDQVQQQLAGLKAEAEAAKLKAQAECQKAVQERQTAIDGQVQRNEPDPIELANCVAEKKKRLVKVASNVEQLIRTEMSKPMPKTCVQKLDQRSKNCYTKAALDDWLRNAKYNMNVFSNVAEISNADGIVLLMLVYEEPRYTVILPEKLCKSFFKRPGYSVKVNSAGDLVAAEGKPNEKPKSKALNCRPCSDFMQTTEGKYADCDNTCDPMYSLLSTRDSFSTKNLNEKAKKPVAAPAA
ncbi:hypothetical protein ECANGB1_881 [Enterospora canceri]|uniref:Uncharacterized protein n=1 Tax=Enterospora canceri TaxID=1081671 RepID=A0A1Y1S7A9_9MICR|nr:hypothetical protein ECANGB1_881 [Enterospora canceri]